MRALRWTDFFNIRPDQTPDSIDNGGDIFVGKSQSAVIELEPGTTHKVRDIVVHGHLTIRSLNSSRTLPPPKLTACRIFVAGRYSQHDPAFPSSTETSGPVPEKGSLTVLGIDLNALSLDTYENRLTFEIYLAQLFLRCREINKREAKKTGLRSIFVPPLPIVFWKV